MYQHINQLYRSFINSNLVGVFTSNAIKHVSCVREWYMPGHTLMKQFVKLQTTLLLIEGYLSV